MFILFFILNCLNAQAAHAQDAEASALWTPPTSVEWVYDVNGQAYDVVNLYVHGSLESVQAAFENAGWIMAAKANGKNNFKYIGAVVFDGMDKSANWVVVSAQKTFGTIIRRPSHPKNIPNPVQGVIDSMPVSKEIRAGNPSDFEFEMNNHPLGGREHFRVFNTHEVDADQNPVWAISASRDIKIKFDKARPKQVFLNHEIETNEDLERDAVLKSLEKSQDLSVDVLQFSQVAPAPADGAYSADGRAYAFSLVPLESANPENMGDTPVNSPNP